MGFFAGNPLFSRATREATAFSRAPRRKRRRRLRCTASSSRGDGALGSRAGRSRWRAQAEDLGARGSFPRPIHLHPPYLRLIPVPPIRLILVPPIRLIHLHLALSRCPCRPQLGRRRHPHRRHWMRRRWPQPVPSVAVASRRRRLSLSVVVVARR